MDYPRTVVLDNKKLRKLLSEKEELILQGREKSMEIDVLEGDMERIEKELVALEQGVDISGFKSEADDITKQYNEVIVKMDDLNKKTREKMMAGTPQEVRDRYDETKKKKEVLEQERNKIALKAQQKSDKIIPFARKEMKKFIENEYEDYDTLRIENGTIVGTVFNHFEDWKKAFEKRKKAN